MQTALLDCVNAFLSQLEQCGYALSAAFVDYSFIIGR